MPIKDLTGHRYGKLTVIKYCRSNKHRKSEWICKCDCGNESIVLGACLVNGHTSTCGKCSNNYYYEENNYMVGVTAKGEKFYFDVEDFQLISKYSWWDDGNGYIKTEINKKTVRLHQLLLKPSKMEKVDHKDLNRANNRRNNLRICNDKNNAYNQSKRVNINNRYSSKYKGVSWDKEKGKWESHITINYKKIHLGRYESETEAAYMYNQAAIKYFGEFARLNEVVA